VCSSDLNQRLQADLTQARSRGAEAQRVEAAAPVRQQIEVAGDALFAGSVGRPDFPGCSHETLMDSIREKL
jgi:hypothetical protein